MTGASFFLGPVPLYAAHADGPSSSLSDLRLRSRDEKRHNEKKNLAERKKHKTEDNARVSALVETAQRLDPRIKAHKASEKAKRDAKKAGGAVVDQKKLEEEAAAKAAADAAAAAEAARLAADDKVRPLSLFSRDRIMIHKADLLSPVSLSARQQRRPRPPRPRTSRRRARPSRPS